MAFNFNIYPTTEDTTYAQAESRIVIIDTIDV